MLLPHMAVLIADNYIKENTVCKHVGFIQWISANNFRGFLQGTKQ